MIAKSNLILTEPLQVVQEDLVFIQKKGDINCMKKPHQQRDYYIYVLITNEKKDLEKNIFGLCSNSPPLRIFFLEILMVCGNMVDHYGKDFGF